MGLQHAGRAADALLRNLAESREETVSADSSARKLSIAILLDKFLPSRGGERYFSFLAEELARQGHDVHVFASKVEADEGMPYQVHIVPVADFPRSARMISYMLFSARMVKRYGFDVIHGLGQSLAVNVLNPHGGVERAYLKQEFASISSTWYYWYRWLRRYLSLRHYLELWMQKRLYTGASVKQVIAISKMVKQDIISHFGFPAEKIAVVFNTVDLDLFHPSIRDTYRSAKRKELGLDDGTILLLFAGNNYRLKGLEPLLHAVAILKGKFPALSLRLVVLGRGQIWLYRRKAKRLAVAESVLFLGPVPGMEAYYAASDIYVHPTFYDSCSLTVLEALACGLPVVTTRFNGASDAILSDEGGKVVHDPANAAEIADAIAFYFDEGRRQRARTVARQWMEQYPPSRNVEETLRVYYEVAGLRGRHE
jgi:UDP-glucose:(heptosyl)LPS alpha-1,3-glucosyltransferase